MPDEISVAYWRLKIASGRAFTLLKRWKTDSSLNASRVSETSRTISPRWRSCSVTAALEVASTSPREGTPARSTALNAKLAMAVTPPRPPAGPTADTAARPACCGCVPGIGPRRRLSSSGTDARCIAIGQA